MAKLIPLASDVLSGFSSFAHGFAKMKMLMDQREDQRLRDEESNERWQQQFEWQKTQAAVANERANRQWDFSQQKWVAGQELRGVQLDTAKAGLEAANIGLGEKKRQQEFGGLAYNELFSMISDIDAEDQGDFLLQSMRGAAAVAEKYSLDPKGLMDQAQAIAKVTVQNRPEAWKMVTVSRGGRDWDMPVDKKGMPMMGEDGKTIMIASGKYSSAINDIYSRVRKEWEFDRKEAYEAIKTAGTIYSKSMGSTINLNIDMQNMAPEDKEKVIFDLSTKLDEMATKKAGSFRDRLDRALTGTNMEKEDKEKYLYSMVPPGPKTAGLPMGNLFPQAQEDSTESYANELYSDIADRTSEVTPELFDIIRADMEVKFADQPDTLAKVKEAINIVEKQFIPASPLVEEETKAIEDWRNQIDFSGGPSVPTMGDLR